MFLTESQLFCIFFWNKNLAKNLLFWSFWGLLKSLKTYLIYKGRKHFLKSTHLNSRKNPKFRGEDSRENLFSLTCTPKLGIFLLLKGVFLTFFLWKMTFFGLFDDLKRCLFWCFGRPFFSSSISMCIFHTLLLDYYLIWHGGNRFYSKHKQIQLALHHTNNKPCDPRSVPLKKQ